MVRARAGWRGRFRRGNCGGCGVARAECGDGKICFGALGTCQNLPESLQAFLFLERTSLTSPANHRPRFPAPSFYLNISLHAFEMPARRLR